MSTPDITKAISSNDIKNGASVVLTNKTGIKTLFDNSRDVEQGLEVLADETNNRFDDKSYYASGSGLSGNTNIINISQNNFNNLTNRDPNTLYLIPPVSENFNTSKIFLGSNLLFRNPAVCPSGQTLESTTGDCYYNVSVITPTGTNVTLNPFAQQETGISLGVSISFQEVTLQGTTTIREFPSANNPTSDFRGIQINTTASFIGDINLTFLLPNNISLSNFNSLSVFNLIDNSNLTVSKNYASKTIQARISYTQNQGLSIMSGNTENRVVLTEDNPCEDEDDGFSEDNQYLRKKHSHRYWKEYDYGLGLFGEWTECCRVEQCTGDGNEFLKSRTLAPANECECMCPMDQNVLYEFGTGTYPTPYTCVDCGRGKVWGGNNNKCRCANYFSCDLVHKSIRFDQVSKDFNCDCVCKEGYTKCGQETIRGTANGKSYWYIKEKCCQPTWSCYEGTCCPPGKIGCGEVCCDPEQICGSNLKCCDETCNGKCCEQNERCVKGKCCAIDRVYEDDFNGEQCCPIPLNGVGECLVPTETWVCKGADQGCGLCYNNEAPGVPRNPASNVLPNCSSIRGAGATHPATSQEECEQYCLKTVTYWRCVSGGGCMSETAITEGGRVPINSDYYATEPLCRGSCSDTSSS